jgi:hypothetical protein
VVDRIRAMRRPGESYSEVILKLVELEAGRKVGMRLPPKMIPAPIAEAQRMAREWKRLGAPGKSRSECALDERAAPRTGRAFARPTEPAGAPYEVARCANPACPEQL